MSTESAAQSGQRIRPVVAVECGGSPGFCRSLVQALAAAVPGPIYRINPVPPPPNAMTVRVELRTDGAARLHWARGSGDIARRDGHDDAEFARCIVVKAGPGLVRALNGA